MSKSLPVLIDTTNAHLKTDTTTTVPLASSALPKFPPKHDNSMAAQFHSTTEIQVEKSEASVKPQYDVDDDGSVRTELRPFIDTTSTSHRSNNHRINGIERQRDNAQDAIAHSTMATMSTTTTTPTTTKQKTHNDEITTKSYSEQRFILADNRYNDVDGMASNDDAPPWLTYRTSGKLSKTMQHEHQHQHQYQPSNARNVHPISRSAFYACSVLILIVILVICIIVSIRRRRKMDAHCDKTNLISNSVSTTSINDCEMDFNHDTSTCIAYTTVIHV